MLDVLMSLSFALKLELLICAAHSQGAAGQGLMPQATLDTAYTRREDDGDDYVAKPPK